MTIRDKIRLMQRSTKFKGYLRTATGYPITLYATMPDKPKSLTVYGNAGGVGGMTVNLFDASACVSGVLSSSGNVTSNSSYVTSDYIPCIANQYYSYNFAITYPIRVCYYNSSKGFLSQVTNQSARALITPANTAYIRVSVAASFADSAMVVMGRYTAETMPPYEPYRYKIPILAGNKTINLYSDVQLGTGDSLTVDPEAETAVRGNTDISALQDWTQDMTLPAANELSVTAGTEVEPGSIEVEYWSKERG